MGTPVHHLKLVPFLTARLRARADDFTWLTLTYGFQGVANARFRLRQASPAVAFPISISGVWEEDRREKVVPLAVVCAMEVDSLRRRERSGLLLYVCQSLQGKKLHTASSLEATYISKGFCNWKEASVRFAAHEESSCHKEAVLKTITMPATTRHIGESLSTQHAKEKLVRRQCFLKLLSNLRFLARQSLPLRGDGDESDSNFTQLLKLRGEDDPRVFDWIKKKTDKCTSGEMQNDIIQVMALEILRKVAASIRDAPFYTIMADETRDMSNREQVVLCIRWVTENFEVREDYWPVRRGSHRREDTNFSHQGCPSKA